MEPSDSDDRLRPVSHIVLGMLATAGPLTSYELERLVSISVSFFWQFPRSQLYAEPQRLAELGLVTSDQEPHGRRRRVHTITDAGRDALVAWLAAPPDERAETRDPALLRLFFADADPDAVTALAQRRVAQLGERLAFLEHPDLGGDRPHHRLVLEYGRRQARTALAFWRDVLAGTDHTPSPAPKES